ncbi:MAG TPA: hypothetical protein V6D02_16685 [Candidatus Obscuribacterales bacterium]
MFQAGRGDRPLKARATSGGETDDHRAMTAILPLDEATAGSGALRGRGRSCAPAIALGHRVGGGL